MLGEQGHLLPHTWIAGDDEMGRSSGFRSDLNDRKSGICWPFRATLIRDLDA
jgi:hypothetical protein